MTQAKPRFRTIEEYLDYDDGTDTRYELVDGELVELPTESWDAGTISLYLLAQLLSFVPFYLIRHKDTEITVTSASAKARIPDLMVVTETTAIEMKGQKGLIPLTTQPPVFVVEVVSPGKPGEDNYERDYVEKPKEYAARGIPEFWQIDPNEGRDVVIVLTLKDGVYQSREFRGSDLVVSPTFPNLQLTAEQILRAGR
jgi:Uma2 family endonuclease